MGCDPCDKNKNADPRYNMMAVTASDADPCASSTTPVSSTSFCPKQEPEFDVIESDFVLPSQGNSITVNVCNNKVYTLNQYIEFIGYGVIMRVSAKDSGGKLMTLINSCANGEEIGNPDAGIGIPRGTPFQPVGSPTCSTDSDTTIVTEALAEMEELCVQAMEEAPLDDEDDEMQVVGRRETAAELGFGKCIRRAAGIFMKLGAFRLPNIRTVDQSDQGNYSMVGVDRTSGLMKKLREVRDFAFGGSGLIDGFKYVMCGSRTVTRMPVGPAFIFSPFYKVLEEKGTITNFATFTAITSGDTYSKDWSLAIAEITNLKNKDLQDHYYVQLHLMLAVQANSGGGARYLEILINDVVVGSMIGNSGGVMYSSHLDIPVKIMNIDTTMNLKIRATGGNGMKYYYKSVLTGAFI